MLPIVPKSVHKFKNKHLPGGPFEYTAFTVGQESILLMVKDSKDPAEKTQAIRQIISECIVTKDYDVASIPLFALELIFLRLREKSIGETMEFSYICKHETAEATEETVATQCNTPIDVKVNLGDVDLKDYEGHNTTVMITDTIGLKMKYPDFEILDGVDRSEIEVMVKCIDYVFDGEVITYAKDIPEKVLNEWYSALEMKVKMNIFKTFMATAPHLYYEQELVCPKCGTKHTLKFTEIQDFFT